MKTLLSTGLALAMLVTSSNSDHGRGCLGHRATIVGPNTGFHAQGFRGVIVGTPGRDVIVGSRRPEWIVGAGGRDAICAGGGRDYIVGGSWSRRADQQTELHGGPGADSIDGGFARDRIVGGPGADGIDGEFGGDHITGSAGDDFIRAQAGGDLVLLGAGADHVETSSGDDVVHGGTGDDNISTGVGADLAFGDDGDDSIHLIWRDDRAYGGIGDDALHGGPGRDVCSGGPGADVATACERKRTVVGDPPATAPGADPSQRDPVADHHPRSAPPGFDRATQVHQIEHFLHRLQAMKGIRTSSATARQIRRKHVLGHRVASLVDRRFEDRLSHAGRVEAIFAESVERDRLKRILAAICDEIDRLRWTP